MYGCQIGTQCPILHAKKDQLYPIGFRNVLEAASFEADALFCMPNNQVCPILHAIRTNRILLGAASFEADAPLPHQMRTHSIAARQSSITVFQGLGLNPNPTSLTAILDYGFFMA
jgi:hypothetical protein